MVSRISLVAVIVGLVLALPVCSEPIGAAGKGMPLQVTSSSLEADGGLKQVVFVGNVVAVQGALTMHADKLIVRYAGQSHDVSQIEALGKVRIEKDGRVATAGRGIYEVGKGVVVLTRSPRVQQGVNSVEGDEIIFYLNEDRSVVKSQAGSRVRAILTPREKSVEP